MVVGDSLIWFIKLYRIWDAASFLTIYVDQRTNGSKFHYVRLVPFVVARYAFSLADSKSPPNISGV